MLFDHYTHGADRRSWSEVSDAVRESADEWDVSGQPPNRLDRLHRVLEQFADVCTQPYTDADMTFE